VLSKSHYDTFAATIAGNFFKQINHSKRQKYLYTDKEFKIKFSVLKFFEHEMLH